MDLASGKPEATNSRLPPSGDLSVLVLASSTLHPEVQVYSLVSKVRKVTLKLTLQFAKPTLQISGLIVPIKRVYLAPLFFSHHNIQSSSPCLHNTSDDSLASLTEQDNGLRTRIKTADTFLFNTEPFKKTLKYLLVTHLFSG